MICRTIILILLLTFPVIVNAQHTSAGGHFTVPDDEACAPYVPVVTAPLCAGGGCTFFPDADDATTGRQLVSGQPIPDFSYQPGVWKMKVIIGNDPATQIIDFFTITIYDATAPAFDFFICSSNRVQLEITDSKYPEYRIDYNTDNVVDATSPSGMVTPSHQYPPAQSGVAQTISVRGNYPNCQVAQKTATPGNFTPATPLITELEVLPSNEIELTLSTSDNYYYELEMSTNSPAAMALRQRIRNEKTLNMNGLNPEAAYYCFRTGVADICSSPSMTYGNTICSADLNLTVKPDDMQLSWSTSNASVASFSLAKSPGAAISLPASASSYNDTNIGCGTQYTYQLISEYGGGIRSISRAYSGTAISNKIPGKIENITARVDGTKVDITWVQDPAFTPAEYTIYRIADNIPSRYATTSLASFSDEKYLTGNHYCYQIEYKDVCGKQSPRSDRMCPIELTAEVARDNTVNLSWTAFNGWAIGVDHYEVEKYASDGSFVTSDAGLSTTWSDPAGGTAEQTFFYRVLAVSTDGSIVALPAVSNYADIILNPNLNHPTAFVPGSSIAPNSVFRVYGNYISEFEMQIFNRWGELLYETTDKDQGWDGTYNGQRMPEGTYVFMVRIIDLAGRKSEYAGTVVLLKKG